MSSDRDIDEPLPPAEPVGAGERLVTLDFIRGIAVLGILVANIVGLSYPHLAYHWPPAMGPEPSGGDAAVWLVQYVLIDGKMRGLFTLLFGAGVYLFLERAWARGESGSLQARRLIWLGLFGLAHFFFLFWGDIVFLYALSGLVLLALAGWDAQRQLSIGIAWYLAGSILLAAMSAPAMLLEQGVSAMPGAYERALEGWDDRLLENEFERLAFTQGSYAAEVDYTVGRAPILSGYPVIALLETIPLMLIGMALYRYGLFSGGIDPRRQLYWGWIGVTAGAAMALAMGLPVVAAGFPPFLTDFMFDAAAQGPRLPAIVGLAALLALWAPRYATSWLGQRLVAAGRMAFSNYIGTSVVAMLVFRHWAGGLWGELDRIELLGVVASIWVLILAWSQIWLAYFRYGPLEYVWRCLTYWRLFPFRR
jgi:uncharacterized protein